ncbi:MAG: REP-associated tyrosine transposase [Terriglobia bacterium]
MNEFRRKNIRLPPLSYIGRQWYFVTVCTEDRREELEDEALVRDNLSLLGSQANEDGFAIRAFCFMPDHLHLLLSGEREDSNCLAFVKGFKQRSAFEFSCKAGRRLWQRGFYDHVLRPTDTWEAVAWYIWMNPVRAGLCQRAEEWPFSGPETLDGKKMIAPSEQTWVPPWKRNAGLNPGATARATPEEAPE